MLKKIPIHLIFSEKYLNKFISHIDIMKIKDAKEIVICPVPKGTIVKVSEGYVKSTLIDKIVSVGDKFPIEFKQKIFDDVLDDTFLGKFDVGDIKWEVIKTIPKEKVRVTNNTYIEILEESPNKDGILKSKLINVKSFPDLKGYIEVTHQYELNKIAGIEGFINRYEDKEKIVYFSDGYYFIKKK